MDSVCRVEFECEYDSLHSLHDRVHPSTRSNNASECDVTFELYCMYYCVSKKVSINTMGKICTTYIINYQNIDETCPVHHSTNPPFR